MERLVRLGIGFLLLSSMVGCALSTATQNYWRDQAEQVHGLPPSVDVWGAVGRGWRYLAEGRCADAYVETELVWGREPEGLFEDVSILRLRSLMCLGRFDEAFALAGWMKVFFPWRLEELEAAQVLARYGRGEDVSELVWSGVREYPEGWVYRVLGAQLLAREGRERDAREQLGILLDRQEDRGLRCGYDVVGHLDREISEYFGKVRVERYWRPVGAGDGVIRVSGSHGVVYGVVMDYCRDRDIEVHSWWDGIGELMHRCEHGRWVEDCQGLLERKSYGKLWDRCLSLVDYEHDDAERVLWSGEVGLRLGLTGVAETAGHALLKRQELMREASVLLSRVYMIQGRTASSMSVIHEDGVFRQ